MHDWRDKGKTNHLLINKVMEYPKSELSKYTYLYNISYYKRYGKSISQKVINEFADFIDEHDELLKYDTPVYCGWHNKEYLRVCYANLYEKHKFGIGKSSITDEEWQRLLDGYEIITNEKYEV